MACLPPPSGPGSVLRRQFNHLSVDTPQEAPVQLPDPDAYHLAALGSGSQELGLFWRAGRAGWGLRGRSRSRPARSTPDFITPQEPPGGSAFALAEKARRPRRGVGWLRSQLSRSGYGENEEELPAPSQSSQGCELGRPPRPAGPYALAPTGRPPLDRAQAVATMRAMKAATASPPCHRNPLLRGAEAEPEGDAEELWMAVPAGAAGCGRYRQDFKQGQRLGRGAFGSVHEVRGRLDGCRYAVKRSGKLTTPSLLREAVQEAQALAAAGAHPNLVRYHCAWLESDVLHIQMELCAGGALRVGLPLDAPTLRRVLRCTAAALAHLHARGIAHLDVKPDNIFDCGGGRFALGDLGTATPLQGGGPPSKGDGDARYLPKELLHSHYGALDRADVWALGASGLELARGRALQANGEEYSRLRSANPTDDVPGLPLPLMALLRRCLSEFPTQRPAAATLAAHPALEEAAEEAGGALPMA